MDIKPRKKRKSATKPSTSGSAKPSKAQAPRPKITIKKNIKNYRAKAGAITLAKPFSFFGRNIGVFFWPVLLGLLYIPSSKIIDTAAQYEVLVQSAPSFNSLLYDVSFAPQKIIVLLIDRFNFYELLLAKIILIGFAGLVVYLFYQACLNLTGKKTAVLATLMFASSSWLILHAQSLVFDSIYLILFPAVLYLYFLFTAYQRFKLKYLAAILSAIVLAIALYSPGIIWPVLGLALITPFFIKKIVNDEIINHIIFAIGIIVVGLIPLSIALISSPESNFLSIASNMNEFNINSFAGNIAESLNILFLNGLNDSQLWLVSTPAVDFLAAILFLAGLIYLFAEPKLRKHLLFFLTASVFSLLAIGLAGKTAVSLIFAVIFFIIAYGIKFLMKSWLAIFPSNPFAKNVGIGIIIAIVVLSSGYNILRYHVAWPRSHSQSAVNSS